MNQWFESVYLLGQFSEPRTGSWFLANNGEAAILELPPLERGDPDLAQLSLRAAQELKASVKFLLCTHAHGDHLDEGTLKSLRRAHPQAEVHLQRGFAAEMKDTKGILFFEEALELSLGEEPLFLVHAPRHSETDTLVMFRGTVCTGDWELGTARSGHDPWSGITAAQKRRSIQRLMDFVAARHYRIH